MDRILGESPDVTKVLWNVYVGKREKGIVCIACVFAFEGTDY